MKRWLIVALLGVALLAACDEDSTASKTDNAVSQAQANLTAEANRQVGMPGITNFTEMKITRKLYELRDQNIATHSYVMDLNGRLFHLCESIGYGLPYGVQFSNPQRVEWYSNGRYTMPQAEPNGLFMPSTAEGTWVICADQVHKGEIAPVYVEPRVIVSPFPLKAVGEWQ